MMELIVKQDAINRIMSVPDGNWKSERYAKEIEKMPSVQPEIILCKDCNKSYNAGLNSERLYCTKHGFYMYEDDFCSYAERKTDDCTEEE